MASITSNTNNTYYAVFNVTETYYSNSENYSDLYYEGVLYSGYNNFSGYTIGYRAKIDNEEVAYHDNTGNQTSMSANSSKVILTGTKRVYHNSDGTKRGMNISLEIWTNNISYLPVYLSASGTMDLTDIPRYVNITSFSVSKRDETSVYYHYTADANCDWAWYSTDNGSTWASLPNNGIVSVLSSDTSRPLSPNTTYNFKLRLRRSDSQLTTDSGTYSQTTYDYPHCTNSPNFVIGQTLTLSLYNPLSREVMVQIIANDGSIWGNEKITGTSIGGYSGDGWRDFFYKSIPNATSGKYQVKVTYGDIVKIRNNGNTYSINRAECMPIFNNFTYKDEGKSENGKEYSTQLTGNPQIIINNYNDFKVVIKPEDKAVAPEQFYATIKKYRAVCGNLADEQPYSPDSEVILNLGCIKERTVTVYAIDSREVSTPVSIAISNDNWKEYTDILIQSALIERADGVGTTATLKFQGTIWNNTFGKEDNKIILCQYRYKKSNESTYSEPIDIIPIREEDLFSFNSTIKGDLEANGFNASNSFNIQIIVEDEIKRTTYDVLLGTGTPAMAIHPNGVAFGAPYDEEEGGSCQVDGISISHKFSTNEKKVGFWTDGKPVYQKTIIGIFADGDVIASNVDTLVNVYGTMLTSGVWRTIPYYEVWNNKNFISTARKNYNSSDVTISIEVEGNKTSADCRITMLYTKTSD